MPLFQNIIQHQEAAVIQWDPTFMLIMYLSIVMVFFLLFILSSIKVLAEWERIVILRLGKYRGVLGPGIVWRTPIIDKIGARISLKAQTAEVETGEVMTRDGAPIGLVGEVRYRVVDIERAFLSLEDYQTTAVQSSKHVMIEQIESCDYDDIVTNRERVESAVMKELDSRFEKWGMAVVGVDLRVQRANM
jgi:regulator of protease activity HflC (stomatin/prohibitin superfamily)